MSKSSNSKHGDHTAGTKGQQAPNIKQYLLPVFITFLLSHLLAARHAPVQDCDEVFNYWEPTHYLTHGHGFQTWEYAPQYGIRSWSYTGLHALIIAALQGVAPTKQALFYALRGTLAAICAACETVFFAAIAQTMNERVGVLFVVITLASPGMYHASVAYLPSSFAMYAAMLGAAAFMNWQSKIKTVQGIVWFALGACLGWPFAVALSIPFLFEEVFWASTSDANGRRQFFWRVATGTAYALLALALQLAVDSGFYSRLVIVPLNIILYNVFSSKGPDLYGTEPWHFYLRNLALNFHVWLPLSLLALPILCTQLAMAGKWTMKARGLVFLAPLYLWLAIFTLQPHKEERFMYPAYPFLILGAAFSLNSILAFLGTTKRDSTIAQIPVMLRLAFIMTFILGTLIITALRVAGTWTSFGAPLQIYEPLDSIRPGGNVCLGKEWYRFPSHYLLPDGFHAKFIKSEFHGLLPGEFHSSPNDSRLTRYRGASINPDGMNDENLEDPGKYIESDYCDFLVDSDLPSTIATSFEPKYIKDTNAWEPLRCVRYLDSTSTPVVPRLLWTPDLAILPRSLRRVWGEYCLLRRRTK